MPDICTKLIAVLDTIQIQPSKRVKRKHDNDDNNNNNDALTVFQNLLTYKNDKDDKDEDHWGQQEQQ